MQLRPAPAAAAAVAAAAVAVRDNTGPPAYRRVEELSRGLINDTSASDSVQRCDERSLALTLSKDVAQRVAL